ncbi:hypothetical protein [Peribacillus sp. NPDC056705]|uniref:hypothetical protein n=1 Tax=Peribacillus sp. NPDC056705 TaxID=3345918 RepID=UPI00374A787A
MVKENPASRLYNLLELADKNSPDTTFRVAWAKVFKVEPADTPALLHRYSNMLDLYVLTKNYILETPRLSNDRNLAFINKIGDSINHISLNGNISNFKNNLNSEALTALYYLSDNISLIHNLEDSIVTDDQISELIKEVDTLISHITVSDLTTDIKQILVKNLHIIRESLHCYFILGIEGVQTALEQSLGSLIMHNQDIRPEVEDENVKGVFKFMSRLNEIISIANGVKDLIAPITQFLLLSKSS